MIDRRSRWIILLALVTKHRHLDVLNAEAVDDYIDRTKARYTTPLFGACSCPQMGRDLSDMARVGLLRRHASGIGDGLCHMGFPKWVWSYRHHVPEATGTDIDGGLRALAFLRRNKR